MPPGPDQAFLRKGHADVLDWRVQFQEVLRILPFDPRGVSHKMSATAWPSAGSSMSFSVNAAQSISTSGTFTPFRAFNFPPRTTSRAEESHPQPKHHHAELSLRALLNDLHLHNAIFQEEGRARFASAQDPVWGPLAWDEKWI